jgi:hypothetical protein
LPIGKYQIVNFISEKCCVSDAQTTQFLIPDCHYRFWGDLSRSRMRRELPKQEKIRGNSRAVAAKNAAGEES